MAISARRKRALGRELRDILFRLCAAAGVLLGLLWDVHHRVAATPASAICVRHHPSTATLVSHCEAGQLSSVLGAWLLPIGIGLLAGCLAGVLLASTVRLGRRPGARRAARSRAR